MTLGSHVIRSMPTGKRPLDRHPGPSLLSLFSLFLPWMPVCFDLGNGIGLCISSCVPVYCLLCAWQLSLLSLSVSLLCDCVYLSCACRRFRCPLLHVFLSFLSLLFSLELCSLSAIAMFIMSCSFCFLCRFLAFLAFLIHCVCWVPFWTSYLHVLAARQVHRTIPGIFANHTGNSHPSQGCFSGEVTGTSARLHRAAPLAKGMFSCQSDVTSNSAFTDGVNNTLQGESCRECSPLQH